MSEREPDDVAFGAVVTFPNGSVEAYRGFGCVVHVDKPDGGKTGAIVICKDVDRLQEFRRAVGDTSDKHWPLAVCHGDHVRWLDGERLDPDGEDW